MPDEPVVPAPEQNATPPATPAAPAQLAAPAQPAAAVDAKALAKEVASELALQYAADPDQEPVSQPQQPTSEQQLLGYSAQELWQQANDPKDPRRANAIWTLKIMRQQQETDAWNVIATRMVGGALPTPTDIAQAKQYYEQNRTRFADPYGAFESWYGQTAIKRDEQRRREAEAAQSAATQAAATVGMPTRSVGSPEPTGPRTMSVTEYLSRVEAEPQLEMDKTAGKLVLTY